MSVYCGIIYDMIRIRSVAVMYCALYPEQLLYSIWIAVIMHSWQLFYFKPTSTIIMIFHNSSLHESIGQQVRNGWYKVIIVPILQGSVFICILPMISQWCITCTLLICLGCRRLAFSILHFRPTAYYFLNEESKIIL